MRLPTGLTKQRIHCKKVSLLRLLSTGGSRGKYFLLDAHVVVGLLLEVGVKVRGSGWSEREIPCWRGPFISPFRWWKSGKCGHPTRSSLCVGATFGYRAEPTHASVRNAGKGMRIVFGRFSEDFRRPACTGRKVYARAAPGNVCTRRLDAKVYTSSM